MFSFYQPGQIFQHKQTEETLMRIITSTGMKIHKYNKVIWHH